MKKKSSLNENALIDLLQAYECLPQNWRVIYHEAFRGNHLLFEPRDVEAFSNAKPLTLASSAIRKPALRTAMRVVRSTNLSEMKTQINELSIESKYYLFRLYLRYVASLREQVQSHLN